MLPFIVNSHCLDGSHGQSTSTIAVCQPFKSNQMPRLTHDIMLANTLAATGFSSATTFQAAHRQDTATRAVETRQAAAAWRSSHLGQPASLRAVGTRSTGRWVRCMFAATEESHTFDKKPTALSISVMPNFALKAHAVISASEWGLGGGG
jgi:hypothetical protein